MRQSTIKSELIRNVFEGKNSVLFDFNYQTFLYERLGNSIHCGSRGELEKLAAFADAVNYIPTFDSETMVSELTGKIGTLILSTTEACNLNCQYCINSPIYPYERTKSNKKMSWDVAKKAIDIFLYNAHKAPTIQFYGGESTLNWELIKKCIEYAKSRNSHVKFGITTNGVTIKKLASDLLSYDMKITISLDGPKEIHDKYRLTHHDEPTYDAIMENISTIRNLDSEFAKSNLFITATCWDLEDFPKIVDFFIDQNGLYSRTFVGFVEKKGLSPLAKEKHQSHHKIVDDFLKYGLIYIEAIANNKPAPSVLRALFERPLRILFTLSSNVAPPTLTLDSVCLPGEFSVFADIVGNFYMCEKMIGHVPLGNIHSGINRTMQINAIQELKQTRDKKCSACWLNRLCHPCFAIAKDSSGRISSDGLSDRCHDYRDSRLVYLALFGTLIKIDKEQRYIEYFKTIDQNSL